MSAFSVFYSGICKEKEIILGGLVVLRELLCSFRAFESLMVKWR